MMKREKLKSDYRLDNSSRNAPQIGERCVLIYIDRQKSVELQSLPIYAGSKLAQKGFDLWRNL